MRQTHHNRDTRHFLCQSQVCRRLYAKKHRSHKKHHTSCSISCPHTRDYENNIDSEVRREQHAHEASKDIRTTHIHLPPEALPTGIVMFVSSWCGGVILQEKANTTRSRYLWRHNRGVVFCRKISPEIHILRTRTHPKHRTCSKRFNQN